MKSQKVVVAAGEGKTELSGLKSATTSPHAAKSYTLDLDDAKTDPNSCLCVQY